MKRKSDQKDIWDKIAAVTPLTLGLIVSGAAGIFGYVHNARQDKLAEITMLEKLEPKLISEERADQYFAYFAFTAMGYGDVALKFISLREDSGAVQVVNAIKRVDSNLTAQADEVLKQLCPEGINDIRDCPDEGCGGKYDPQLNRLKNIRSDSQQPTKRSLKWIKDLGNPMHFTEQNTDRNELKQLGEGQKITVVAYALAVKKGARESCNCGLTAPKDTDNYIVLVDPALTEPTLRVDERDSVTAEFTPRARLDHPNFTQEKLEPLIDEKWVPGTATKEGKLLVRVTGLLLFDSAHSLGRPLMRHNNWEIHPVLKLEYCPSGQVCRVDSDANWKDLDSD